MLTSQAAGYQISIQVFEEFEGLLDAALLERVAQLTLDLETERRGIGELLSIVVADDGTVRELNRTHRGLDENTDVLSFSFEHAGEYYGDGAPPSQWSEDVNFVMPPDESAGLGEVIISYPQVARQAAEAGHSVERELVHMLAHGILHLLGYDHEQPDDEAAMRARENQVLAQLS
ncbi:MAG: rRNA maturation RNase YbeY [Chloroflexi bacterium]|nr:rRNA maturation RNase YbeY [Chloroflexota bacterium]